MVLPGYGNGHTLGTATGAAVVSSGGCVGVLSGTSALTSESSGAGAGATARGGGSLATGAARSRRRPGGGLRIGSPPETETEVPSYQLNLPRAVADASRVNLIRSEVGNEARADCLAAWGRSKKDMISPQASGGGAEEPELESPAAATVAGTSGAGSSGIGETAAEGSSRAGSVVSPLSEVGDGKGAGPETGAVADSSPEVADVRSVDGISAAPTMI